MKTWIPWRRAWLMMLMKRIFYLGHCTFQTSICLKKHSSSMFAILIILGWSKWLDCGTIFQKVTDILSSAQSRKSVKWLNHKLHISMNMISIRNTVTIFLKSARYVELSWVSEKWKYVDFFTEQLTWLLISYCEPIRYSPVLEINAKL